MSECSDVVRSTAAAPEYVAPLLPPTAPPPAIAERINFFRAFSCFWLFPKRLGPHLAVGSLRRAVLAHGLALILATGIALAGPLHYWVIEILPGLGLSLTLHTVRVELAETVLQLAAESTSPKWSWVPVLVALGAIPLFEIVLLMVATVAMPWCAGGDRASSVWKRSVKNVYWTTTFGVPVALVVVAGQQVDLHQWEPFDTLLALLGLTAIFLGVVLAARMLITGAHRYVGEPDGPAFAPRQPTCDDCGYAIVHLPLENRCPECGLPIRESLPGGRRQPTVWQEREFRAKGFQELLRLQWVVVRDPSFFRRIPVHSGMASARHFWWGTFLVMSFVILALVELTSLITWNTRPNPGAMNWLGLGFLYVLLLLLLHAVGMLPVCLWAQLGCGIRDYRVSAIVCYYSTPLLWPAILAVLVTVLLFSVAGLAGKGFLSDPGVEFSDAQVWFWGVVALICVGVVAWAWFFWLRRLLAAMRAVCYANV
jgi:hypothetical protein